MLSDDFSSGSLDPSRWSFTAPARASAGLGTSGGEAFLRWVTPAGNYDPYDTNNGARLMQAAADGNVQIVAKWLSTPSARYQAEDGTIVNSSFSGTSRCSSMSASATI